MKIDLYDVLALAGGVVLAAGLWMIYPPAALIGLGLALVGFGLYGAWLDAMNKRARERNE